MGHDWSADNSKSKDRLGLNYRSLELSINEMFQQMIDQGAFKKS
jgi:dihydroflavonol-4-reductase